MRPGRGRGRSLSVWQSPEAKPTLAAAMGRPRVRNAEFRPVVRAGFDAQKNGPVRGGETDRPEGGFPP
ncbi:tryptophan 2,3-dioxygenase [Streptomyces azureus]|uniref:Tryptophan 2,3-dioxygenase n=1 Tax=Streptomyces azureus TaxID=146537 RepID=A0A0K8PPT1_STRAJ|nr:tryptophan 2,3-dioxygenase [Streptomyces azureus]